MERKYKAILACQCGYQEELSDKDYEDILMERKELVLKCGHWKYGAKISAKHSIRNNDWRMGYGSTK
jgi:hypothetical protein